MNKFFLNACDYQLPLHYKNEKPKDPTDKDLLFNGLNEVVKFLCYLDHVSNVMDYTKLFEFENEKPKYELGFSGQSISAKHMIPFLS